MDVDEPGIFMSAKFEEVDELEVNLTFQKEELEALRSIYGEDFTVEDEFIPTFSIVVGGSELEGREATLVVSYSSKYPLFAPPIYHLSIPWLRGVEKQEIYTALGTVHLENHGRSIVYDLVEKLRELLTAKYHNFSESANTTNPNNDNSEGYPLEVSSNLPHFVTGEPLTDRKSTFQAHVVALTHPDQIKLLLGELVKHKRIAAATHNMYAYRIFNTETKIWWQDCDDDGETHAGSRLLHLLQILDCQNVLIVVSRWFGGIMLHGDRFKHINNVARKILESEGFITTSSKRSR